VSEREGFVGEIIADEIGKIIMDWGGGRIRLEDSIDQGVGIYLQAKYGDRVAAGAPLATAYYNNESLADEMCARLSGAYRIVDDAPAAPPLIREVI
jgi:pyrimidine-nucleoside phosphorylase